MILSDVTIRGAIENGYLSIQPEPEDWQFQPSSIELTLGNEFLSPYDIADEPFTHENGYLIGPGECMLATTNETITLGDQVVGRVEGKSSWGRKFLMVHSTAGFIDPGFTGKITLELVNLSKVSQVLPSGTPIAQISFQWTTTPVQRPYGNPELNSHYQGQSTVTPSAIPWG